MALLGVVQSRLSSTRLPAKAMLSVGGVPMVVLAALRAGNRGAPVVVATSREPEDDVVAMAAERAEVGVVRGPLSDPLARFVLAADGRDGDDVVVRLTADNVFPDGSLLADLAAAVTPDHPYVRVGGDDRSLPYGIAGEAFTVAALRAADAAATSATDREHVTPWIRREYGDRVLSLPPPPPHWRGLRCTVDAFDDFVLVARLFADVSDPVGETWQTLCDRLAEHCGPAAEQWSGGPASDQTPMILGTVQLGVPYGAANPTGLPSDAGAAAVLQAAAAHGLSHLDTARAYGRSESRIGRALVRGLSEHVGVITKVRPLDDVPVDADPGWGRAAVEASVAISQRELRCSPDVLLVHRAADWRRPGVRTALEELREAGVCRRLGVSLSRPDELLDVLTDDLVGHVQLPFNLLDRRWLTAPVQEALAARPDVVVTCRSVFLQGLLVVGEEATWPVDTGVDPPAVIRAVDAVVDEVGRESRADLCIAHALGQPWVTSVVLGAENATQVADSARLARHAPLTPDQIRTVEERLPAAPERLLDPSLWVMP